MPTTHPLPLAAWQPVNFGGASPTAYHFGSTFGLRPLPDGVLPPEPDQRSTVQSIQEHLEQASTDARARLELGALLVNVSASHVGRRQPQEAVEAAEAALQHFDTYASMWPGGRTAWVYTRRAAAWYNAALAFWWGDQDDAAAECLKNAEDELQAVDASKRQDTECASVATAINGLRAWPSESPEAGTAESADFIGWA